MTHPDHQYPYLDEKLVDPDPIRQFGVWFEDARTAGVKLPEAMTLATADASGKPSARMVLLKEFRSEGFIFYSNYQSRKGGDLSTNPAAALVFYWPDLDRQVRVEGTVVKLPAHDSDVYFATRPRDGQLSSLASAQSQPVTSRAELDETFEQLKLRYAGKLVPRPDHWGGYRLTPEKIEFWQQRFARLNDRVLYTLQPDGGWSITRLAP